MRGGEKRRKENASSADGGLRLSQNLDSYRPMCDTSLSNQRRYAPRVADLTGLSGRFDRNTHSDESFLRFQNDLAQSMYDALGQGYSAGQKEIPLVKSLIDAINGKTCNGIRIHAKILHGSRSHVDFKFMNQPVTKEFGDMAVIALITNGGQRLFQKTCIIQNKTETGKSWRIDAEQLFLLKNFPTFSGTQGVFVNCHNVIFRNNSGCLGAYGLFQSPGEMIFASAPLVAELLCGRGTLPAKDISVFLQENWSRRGAQALAFPMWRHPEDFFYMFEKMYGFSFGLTGNGTGFLGNVHFSRDLYDFAKNWTQFNIGEISCVNDDVVNSRVDAFSNHLIRQAKFDGLGEFPLVDNIFGDAPFEGELAVMVMHLDVGENE